MKKQVILTSLTLLISLWFCTEGKSQQVPRLQEFVLSLDAFEGLHYRNAYYKLQFKNKENKYWRARLGHYSDLLIRDNSTLFLSQNQVSVGLGFEGRLPLIRKSQLVLGVEPFGIIDRSRQQVLNKHLASSNWAAGVGFPIGIIFNTSAEWFVSVEALPMVSFQQTIKDDFGIYNGGGSTINSGFNSYAIGFGYRIPTKRI